MYQQLRKLEKEKTNERGRAQRWEQAARSSQANAMQTVGNFVQQGEDIINKYLAALVEKEREMDKREEERMRRDVEQRARIASRSNWLLSQHN
jgi:glutathione S-transferase